MIKAHTGSHVSKHTIPARFTCDYLSQAYLCDCMFYAQRKGEAAAYSTSRVLTITPGTWNQGLAMSPNGALFAVSNLSTRNICVYSVRDGARQAEFGASKLAGPRKLCFSPGGESILVADTSKLVQVYFTASFAMEGCFWVYKPARILW